MTPPRAPGDADAARRPSLPLLAVPGLLMFVVAAVTPPAELFTNQGDVGLYLQKATAVMSGQVPYRDFALEYPPLALVPMVVAYLLGQFGELTLDSYKWLFVGWQAVLLVILALVLARVVALGGRGDIAREGAGGTRRLITWTTVRLWVLCAGAALAIAWRFDLFPALLTVVALWAALAGRPGATGVAVGLGVLAKLYPIVLVPAIAVPWLVRLDTTRLTTFGVAVLVTVVVGLLPFVVLAGPDALYFLGYQAQRGLQLESVAGGLIMLGGLLSGLPPPINHEFSSVQVAGPMAATALAVLPLLTVTGFGLLAWLGWRRARVEAARDGAVAPSTIVKLATASILLLLITSKVFSIQYIVWLVPFAALLPRGQFWLAAIAVGLSMPIHPLLYGMLVEQGAVPILVLNLRNALLLILTMWIVADLRPSRMQKARG